VGEKARQLGYIIRLIRTKLSDQLPIGVYAGSRFADAYLDDLVACFNVLTLPRGYVYVDKEARLIHLVLIDLKNSLPGMMINHEADVVWRFNPTTGLWNTTKDRTGLFEPLCPIKAGGIKT
jgi:hypothetical protein